MFQILLGNNKQQGFIFLEILIATALIGIAFMVLLGIGFSVLNLSNSIQKTNQADALVKEELEALRSYRDNTSWATNGLGILATGSVNPFYMSLNTGVSPSVWQVTSGTETTGIFTRKFVIDRASRDTGTNSIEAVYNAAHDDANTRKITVTVTWESKTYQVVSYLTNWK